MESKKYLIQGQEFEMIGDNLTLLNRVAPMIARLRKLMFEYTKDIDTSGVSKYTDAIKEPEMFKERIEAKLESGLENDVLITDERRVELEQAFKEYQDKIDKINAEYDEDVVLKNAVAIKEELGGYAFVELITDIPFIKPIFKKILINGNVDKIDFTDIAVLEFIKDVCASFFTIMKTSNLKP